MTATTERDTVPNSEPARRPQRQAPRSRTLRRGVPIIPAVVLMLIFMAGPIIYSLYLAFTNRALRGEGASETSFVGFDNFITAFASDDFWNAVWLTVLFTLISAIIGQNLLGMILALMMRKATKVVTAITGTIVIGAWILPEVVAAYLWYTFLGDEGSLNRMLGFFNLPSQEWLFTIPIMAVAFANIWRGAAFSMLIYTAALAQVDPAIDEAATMDGAGRWLRFFSVTVPIIRRSIMTNLMLITLQTLSVFGLIFIMTGGGPGNSSQTLPLYMYEQAFSFGQIGYGTAVALLLLLIGALASILYLKMLPEEEKI